MAKFMLGNIRHQLDDKGRMRIPARFRDGVGASPCVLPGRPGCLYIIPEDKLDSVVESLGSQNLYSDYESNDAATDILGNGYFLEEDGQGRVRLTKDLCDAAAIGKDIVFAGKGTYLEIWPAEVWDRKFSVLNPENLNRVLEKLKKLGV